jgi:hypothetical protein
MEGEKMKYLKILICLAILGTAVYCQAADRNVGILRTANGQVFVERQGKLIPVKIGQVLIEKDSLVTKAGSAGIIFKDDSLLSVGPNSKVSISDFVFEPAEKKMGLVAFIKRGTMVYLGGLIAKLDKNAVQLKTETTVCGIRGTHVAIQVEGGEED